MYSHIISIIYFIVIQTAYDKVADGIKSHHNIYTMDKAYLRKSTDKEAKWDVSVFNGSSPITITFGASKYQDYTQHKSKARQLLYLARHRKREDWRNWTTAGFWSRWLLWSKPNLDEAKDYIETKFNIKIIMGKPPKTAV